MEFRFDLFEVTRQLIARPGKVKGDLTHMREGGPLKNIRNRNDGENWVKKTCFMCEIKFFTEKFLLDQEIGQGKNIEF